MGSNASKNQRLSNYIYSSATLKCKVCLMSIKSGHLHLTYVFPIIIVVRALDSQSSSVRFKTAGWPQVQFILSSF